MAKSPEATPNQNLLVWAREEAGFDVEQVAQKISVKSEKLELWEAGEQRPTIVQLRNLANAYKRPVAVFYLPKPPKPSKPIRDFRRLPLKSENPLSPRLRLEIRRTRERREIALDLFRQVEGKDPSPLPQKTSSANPDNLASEIRRDLGITYELQREYSKASTPYFGWRSAVESLNVLVFQASRIELSEMRGFSISEMPFPVIVVNAKDFSSARIFTLLHEFVHILLRRGGLCSELENERDRNPEEQKLEAFANRIAGAILVPKEHLLEEDIVKRKSGRTEWSDLEIRTLADRYGASREALLRRLLICERTTSEFYRKKREKFGKAYGLAKKRKQTGGPPPSLRAINSAGPSFVRLILNSYYQDRITRSDLSDFLEVRLKHIGRIEQEVFG